MVKFVTEIVTGDCPECNVRTMLVNIYTNWIPEKKIITTKDQETMSLL